MRNSDHHRWEFQARFRRNAFGWRSDLPIKRIKEALSEIRKIAKKDKILAGEGAVVLLEKISPALEQVDSSSGSIGSAVNYAIETLVTVIAAAPVDTTTREGWLERLFRAHEADAMPYIERLADYWGELCASPELASRWADDLIGITRMALSPDKNLRGHFHGTTACLSSLLAADRYDELLDVLKDETFWTYKRWAAKALVAQGRKAEAVRYAESCRSPWASDGEINRFCEEILISSGLVDEAYKRYGLQASRAGTYLAWFRAVIGKYPHKTPAEVLKDLVAETPGDEGKWFAAAKSAQLFDEALELVQLAPCDPRTLIRAARDYSESNPLFAKESGMAALRWMAQGYGYEITGAEVLSAFSVTMQASRNAGCVEESVSRIREEIGENGVMLSVLGKHFGFGGGGQPPFC